MFFKPLRQFMSAVNRSTVKRGALSNILYWCKIAIFWSSHAFILDQCSDWDWDNMIFLTKQYSFTMSEDILTDLRNLFIEDEVLTRANQSVNQSVNESTNQFHLEDIDAPPMPSPGGQATKKSPLIVSRPMRLPMSYGKNNAKATASKQAVAPIIVNGDCVYPEPRWRASLPKGCEWDMYSGNYYWRDRSDGVTRGMVLPWEENPEFKSFDHGMVTAHLTSGSTAHLTSSGVSSIQDKHRSVKLLVHYSDVDNLMTMLSDNRTGIKGQFFNHQGKAYPTRSLPDPKCTTSSPCAECFFMRTYGIDNLSQKCNHQKLYDAAESGLIGAFAGTICCGICYEDRTSDYVHQYCTNKACEFFMCIKCYNYLTADQVAMCPICRSRIH